MIKDRTIKKIMRRMIKRVLKKEKAGIIYESSSPLIIDIKNKIHAFRASYDLIGSIEYFLN